MKSLSRYEKISIALAAVFVLLCAGYFLSRQAGEQPYRVTVTKTQEQVSAETAQEEASWPDSLLPGEKININTASAWDLSRLPGIGEKRGEDIVSWRETNGTFETPQDLMKVSGIGEGILAGVVDYITVERTD